VFKPVQGKNSGNISLYRRPPRSVTHWCFPLYAAHCNTFTHSRVKWGMYRDDQACFRCLYTNSTVDYSTLKTVNLHTLKRWQSAQQRALDAGNPGALNKKRGKKVCTQFEDDVYHKVTHTHKVSFGARVCVCVCVVCVCVCACACVSPPGPGTHCRGSQHC